MYHNHWSERLSEAIGSADTASSQEVREVYLSLAGHYRGLITTLGSPGKTMPYCPEVACFTGLDCRIGPIHDPLPNA